MVKLTEDIKQSLISLYEEGKMDSEIAKILGIQRATIQYWRTKLGLKTKFSYVKISKITKENFEPLFYAGKGDAEIAKALGVSYDGVYWFRLRNHYTRESRKYNPSIALTDFQKQVLIGTVLGDASLTKNFCNTAFTCAHCKEKEEYTFYKRDIFKSLGAKIRYTSQYDERTNKTYERCLVTLPANPELNKYYSLFYRPKKVIPLELLPEFTEVSLAFMFMDDGYKDNSYCLSTNCFTRENLEEFKKFLYERFGIISSIRKSRVMHILATSRDLFTKLVSPYICECMKYKLHQSL